MAEGHAERAQGSHHAAPLLKSETDRAMDDENANREAEEAEGREVEVEAVGKPADIGRALGSLQHEVWRDLGQRALPQGLVRQDDQTADATDLAKQLLGNADVGKHGPWRNHLISQNRVGQICRKERGGLRACDQRICAQKAVEVGVRQRGARGRSRRRSQRIDADQPHRSAADAQPSLYYGADQPAGTPKRDEKLLWHGVALAGQKLVEPSLGQRGGSRIVARARLGVDGLHARPQRRRQREAKHQRQQLQPVASPVRSQCREHRCGHASWPWLR